MATKKDSNIDRLAAIREKLKKTDLGGGRSGFWSPKTGKNTIRILPEVGEMEYFFQTVGRHVFPPDDKKSVYCPAFTSEGELECPVCELIDQFRKSGDKASKALANALRVRRMYWMNVIDRSDEDSGPQIFTPGVTIFNSLVSIINDPDYGEITDTKVGFDINIERTGTGLATEYEVRPRPRPGKLSDNAATMQEWLEKAKDLSVVEVSEDPEEDSELSEGHAVYLLPYDRIVSEFDLDDIENLDVDVPDNDEVEQPKKSKKAAKPVVDDNAEEYDDDDDDDEPPAKKEVMRRRAARPSARRK